MKEKLSFAIGGRRVTAQLPEISIVRVKFFGADLKLNRWHNEFTEKPELLTLPAFGRGQYAKYFDEQGRECVPMRALWSALRDGSYRMDGATVHLFLPATDTALVPLSFRECYLEERAGLKGLIVAPHYRHWSCELDWEVIGDPEHFLKVCQYAGREVGIGVGRPARGHGFGRFDFELINSRRAEAA